MKPFITLSVFLLFCFRLLAQQPGTLDPSFGEGGLVKTSITQTAFYSNGRASARQKDNKILLGGNYYVPGVRRYLPNGIIDSTFGINGTALIDIEAFDVAGIAIQTDGMIVITGNSISAPYTAHVYAARFTKDGNVDESFGNKGVTTLDYGDYAGVGGIALQADDKAILTGGGGTVYEAYDYSYLTVTRLTKDGLPDKTFGGTGRIINTSVNNGTCVVVQPDGNIVTEGYRWIGVPSNRYVMSRYRADGTLDATFGSGGNAIAYGFGYDGKPQSLALQPDGKLVVVGQSNNTGTGIYSMAALRYLPNGTPDNSFGTGGETFVPFAGKNAIAYDVLLQADGKLILTGSSYGDVALNGADFALCRLMPDGKPDSSFGTDGIQITRLPNTEDISQSAILQFDGNITLFGYSANPNEGDGYVLLARYFGSSQKTPLYVKVKRWLQNHTISVYPNPAKDYIVVTGLLANERANLSIVDAGGNVKMSGISNNTQYRFQIGSLNAGTYYVRIVAGNGVDMIPFIKD